MNRKQRRAQEKQRRKENKAGRAGTVVSMDYETMDPNEWRADFRYHKPIEESKEVEVPGVNIPPVDPEFEAKVARNSWHDREEFIEFVKTIQQLSQEDIWEADGNTLKPGCLNWSWARNWNCKYVNLRIDMRDGGFVMTNSEGERINLEQLRWQYRTTKEQDL